MKILKISLWIMGIIALFLTFIYFITISKIEFNFANEGKIICVTKKDWGFFSRDNLICFNITPIGKDENIQRFKCKILNDEIILTK